MKNKKVLPAPEPYPGHEIISLRERLAEMRNNQAFVLASGPTPEQLKTMRLEADQAVLDVVAAANNLRTFLSSSVSPSLDPDYVASIEKRVRRAFPSAFNN